MVGPWQTTSTLSVFATGERVSDSEGSLSSVWPLWLYPFGCWFLLLVYSWSFCSYELVGEVVIEHELRFA